MRSTKFALGSATFKRHAVRVAATIIITSQPVAMARVAQAAKPSQVKTIVLQGYGADSDDRLVLDLATGKQQLLTKSGQAVGRARSLADCSDGVWFCGRSRDADGLVWAFPRTCVDAKVGDVWRHGGADLVVLQRFDPVLPQAGRPGEPPPIPADALVAVELLLGSPKRPDVVYRYNQSAGVVGAYFRRSPKGPTPYAEARAGRIDRTKDQGQPTLYRAVVRPAPFYPVDFARCRPAPLR
jgi:hypothetical protein